MKTRYAAAMIMLVAGPVYAQEGHVRAYGEPDPPKSARQIETDKDSQKAYQNSLGNISDKPAVDPWGNARSADAPKEKPKAMTKTRQAKPATKTGSATTN
jgi:hypothetical protein